MKVLYKDVSDLLRDRGVFFSPGNADRFQPHDQLHFDEQTRLEGSCGILWGNFLGRMGMCTYSWSALPPYVTAGRYCSIAGGTTVMGGRHPIECVSSSSFIYDPGFSIVQFIEKAYGGASPRLPNFQKWGVTLDNDVWVGEGVVFAQGVRVGTGAVIAARTVVTKDVPPYAIVGGNPGKIIRYRFAEDVIARLLETEWWNLQPSDLKQLDLSNPSIFLDQLYKHDFQNKFDPLITTHDDLVPFAFED